MWTDITIIVLIIALVIALIVIGNKSTTIKNLEKDKGTILQAAESRLKKVREYADFFNKRTKVFSLDGIQEILDYVNDYQNQTNFNQLFNEGDQKDVQEFFYTLQGLCFEKFVMDLPVEAGSFLKIINFNYKHLLPEYSIESEKVHKRVMEIWYLHLKTLKTIDEVHTTYIDVSGKIPFFYDIYQKGNTEAFSEWYTMLMKRMRKASQTHIEDLQSRVMHASSNDDMYHAVKEMFRAVNQNHLDEEGEKYIRELFKPLLKTALRALHTCSANSSIDAKRHAELKEIQEKIYPDKVPV